MTLIAHPKFDIRTGSVSGISGLVKKLKNQDRRVQ